MKGPRESDVLSMKVTSNDGVRVEDSTLCKPGAKDGLSGTNVTEPFTTNFTVPKPHGGMASPGK